MKKNDAMRLAKDANTSASVLEAILGIHKSVDQILAQHPNTPASLLTVLASGSDKAAQRYAMVHPHLPLEHLVRLSGVFPADLIAAPGLGKFSHAQIAELAGLIGPVKWTTLLKHEDCPINVQMWAIESGTDAMRMVVAKRHQMLPTVKTVLMNLGGEFAAATSKVRKLTVDWRGWVIGDYPKFMNIRDIEKSEKAKKRALDESMSKLSHPVSMNRSPSEHEPDLYFSNNDVVESIKLNIDELCVDYVIFENLSNLHTIEIVGDLTDDSSSLSWIVFKNLPTLKSVSICGHVRWAKFDGVPLLHSTKLNNCVKLARLEFLNAPSLVKLDLANCRLLRNVEGLDAAQLEQLQVSTQINEIQVKSKLDLKLKKSMTYTELDAVLKTINEGYKLAVQKGLLCSSEVDLCYGREKDPDFHPFSYRTLRPREPVYTGGTGETYFYEQCCHDYANGQYGIWGSMGCTEPEDCLTESLRTVIDLSSADSSPAKMLKFFGDLLSQTEVQTGCSSDRELLTKP